MAQRLTLSSKRPQIGLYRGKSFFYSRLVILLKTEQFYRNGEKSWTFFITEQFEAGKFYRQQ